MIEFLSTTDPKLVGDWVLTLFFSILSVLGVILAVSFVAKTVAEMWGLGKWL